MGAPSHPTASTLLEVGRARAGLHLPEGGCDGPDGWQGTQPKAGGHSPHKAAAVLLAFIKVFCCIIDICVNPWEAAGAGSSNQCFQ